MPKRSNVGPRRKVHGVWSFTKSFTRTVLGLLIDDGKCALDTPAARFVPALAEGYSAVTLKHFATVTLGYRAVGDEAKTTSTNPATHPLCPIPNRSSRRRASAVRMHLTLHVPRSGA